MATMAISHPLPLRRTFAASLSVFGKETKYEFLKLLRTKSFSLSVIGFPVMFYVLFGLANRSMHTDGVAVAKYMVGGYASFGMVGAALFGIGVGLASERSLGWLELKRASPMPPMAYLLAKCITAQVFGVLIVSTLIAIAMAFGGVQLSAVEIARMLGLSIVGTVPFAAMGLLLALLVPANAASGIVNLIYLPMSMLGGLWIPIYMLPRWLRAIAPYTPTFHLNQLMLSCFGYQSHSYRMADHWTGLAGFTLVMLGAAWAVFHRSEQNA
jgi:ABC-2 type transport system permease protein